MRSKLKRVGYRLVQVYVYAYVGLAIAGGWIWAKAARLRGRGATVSTDAYHAHLAICPRCAARPFDLCEVGDRLLRVAIYSADDPAPERTPRDAELEELGRAIRETHRDPVLQALHVGCGAIAIGAMAEELEEITRGIG